MMIWPAALADVDVSSIGLFYQPISGGKKQRVAIARAYSL